MYENPFTVLERMLIGMDRKLIGMEQKLDGIGNDRPKNLKVRGKVSASVKPKKPVKSAKS